MPVTRTSKMLAYVNYRMRVTIADGRQIVGRFMAFDRHMNLVLSDAEEFRKLPPKKGLSEEERQTRRVLGFVLLRGEEVVSLTVEGPPPSEDRRAAAQQAPAGPGSGRAAGRGLPGGALGAAQPGLQGPVTGVGGPAAAHMRPQFASGPAMRPPGGPPPGFRPGMPPPGFRPGMPPAGMPPPGFRPGPPGPPM
jgi:small nuclear ribonucleoprotein B and B'